MAGSQVSYFDQKLINNLILFRKDVDTQIRQTTVKKPDGRTERRKKQTDKNRTKNSDGYKDATYLINIGNLYAEGIKGRKPSETNVSNR